MIGIVGAGPGGLTAALALRRRGFDVEVLERAPSVRPVGAGLTLQRNAMAMLETIGLADAVTAAGHPLRDGRLTRADGALLASLMEDESVRPGVGIHRGALSDILTEALPAGVIRLSTGVRSVDDEGTVELDDGTRRAYNAVIGADGIHSAVRTALFGPRPLRYSGTTCWRGVAEHEGRDYAAERWGRGLRFGSVPLGSGLTYWFACANAPAGGVDGAEPGEELAARFGDFEPLVLELIRASTTILRHDLTDIEPLSQWTRGRVTLLGDAAHPMTPNLGQGACQAIEDAVILARCLAERGVPEGLEAYETARRPRATTMVRRSWTMGQIAQWSNPLACAIRNLIVAWTPRMAVQRNVQRLLDVDGSLG